MQSRHSHAWSHMQVSRADETYNMSSVSWLKRLSDICITALCQPPHSCSIVGIPAGDQLRPSELQRSLKMRLQNLKTAVAKSHHNIQVLFVAHSPIEINLVSKAMAGQSEVQCKQVHSQYSAQLPDSSCYFKLCKQEA